MRLEERRARRNWLERWRAAGGRVFPGTGLDGRAGRLVALKNDPVWTNLSEFGLPYPPFAYGSGVGVEDVGRETAVALGLIDEQTQIAPQSRGFNAELEAELPPLDRQSALFKAILQSMGDAVEIAGDVLRFKQAA